MDGGKGPGGRGERDGRSWDRLDRSRTKDRSGDRRYDRGYDSGSGSGGASSSDERGLDPRPPGGPKTRGYDAGSGGATGSAEKRDQRERPRKDLDYEFRGSSSSGRGREHGGDKGGNKYGPTGTHPFAHSSAPRKYQQHGNGFSSRELDRVSRRAYGNVQDSYHRGDDSRERGRSGSGPRTLRNSYHGGGDPRERGSLRDFREKGETSSSRAHGPERKSRSKERQGKPLPLIGYERPGRQERSGNGRTSSGSSERGRPRVCDRDRALARPGQLEFESKEAYVSPLVAPFGNLCINNSSELKKQVSKTVTSATSRPEAKGNEAGLVGKAVRAIMKEINACNALLTATEPVEKKKETFDEWLEKFGRLDSIGKQAHEPWVGTETKMVQKKENYVKVANATDQSRPKATTSTPLSSTARSESNSTSLRKKIKAKRSRGTDSPRTPLRNPFEQGSSAPNPFCGPYACGGIDPKLFSPSVSFGDFDPGLFSSSVSFGDFTAGEEEQQEEAPVPDDGLLGLKLLPFPNHKTELYGKNGLFSTTVEQQSQEVKDVFVEINKQIIDKAESSRAKIKAFYDGFTENVHTVTMGIPEMKDDIGKIVVQQREVSRRTLLTKKEWAQVRQESKDLDEQMLEYMTKTKHPTKKK